MQDLRAIRFVAGTKISHDYSGKQVNTFSYRELVDRQVPNIGIPAKQNRLLIVDIDVAGESHQHDGREWWTNFCQEYNIPQTYTVKTPSGGFHCYFKIPEFINLDTFSPPAHPKQDGMDVLGVDFKYNGWAGAPPTPGYAPVYGTIQNIAELPQNFLEYISDIIQGRGAKTFDNPQFDIAATLHQPFSDEQIEDLRKKFDWTRTNATLSRDEWRDGIFALRSGINDEALLEEMVTLWTMNQSYVDGDENEAIEIAKRADQHGSVGPGTIFAIIKRAMMRSGIVPDLQDKSGKTTPWTREEIFERAGVSVGFDRQGNIKVEPSESNAASVIGAIYGPEDLYFDTRNDLYIFNGESYSDTELTNKFLPVIQSTNKGLGLEKFRAGIVSRGVDILMAARKRDPHMEYLKSLQWDGTSRLETFFIDFLGVPDNEYYRTIGKNFWTALAARGLNPGCKFDSMLVLEGHEGIRKSSLVEIIGGRDYTFAPISNKAFEDIDELRKMHQSVVVELPELIGLINRPAEMVKGFLANPVDTIRDLFAKRAKQNKRGFVLVGTTNSDKYLSVGMGLRRFWPVRIPEDINFIDTGKISQIRDQLFAEGIHWYRNGHSYWEVPEHLLAEQTSQRIMMDPLMQCVKNSVENEQVVDTMTVYRRLEATGYVSKGFDMKMARRIEDALRSIGYDERGAKWYAPFKSNPEPQPDFIAQYSNLI